MKKLLTLAVLLVFAASSAFAGVTTITKEASQANYPGVLVPGSLSGIDTFVTDLSALGNAAVFEYMSGAIGHLSMKTNMGTLGLSLKGSSDTTLSGIAFELPNNLMTLRYLTDLSGMKVGAAVVYGSDSTGFTNKDDAYGLVIDESASLNQHAGIVLGATIASGLDVSGSFALANLGSVAIGKDATGQIDYKNNTDNSKIIANVAGRLALDKETKAVLSVDLVTGSSKLLKGVDSDNDGDITDGTDIKTETIASNMEIGATALIGKEIKASETLMLKMAGSLNYVMTGAALGLFKDIVGDTSTYSANTYGVVTVTANINVAVEGKLNDTWMITGGVGSRLLYVDWSGNKENPNTDESKFDETDTNSSFGVDPELDFAIGLTGKVGDLTLDLFVEPSILLTGPWFLTGAGSGSLNSGIAISYAWK